MLCTFHPHPRPYSEDYQMGGSQDPVPGVGVGGGAPLSHMKHRSSENIPLFESQRMALVITLHHKYIQLSDSNHTLPIHSRIGVIMTLELWPSMIIARHTHVSFYCLCCIVDNSSETASIMTVIPLWLVESVYRLHTIQFMLDIL